MKLLVASDGHMPTDRTAELVGRLGSGPDDDVVLFTVVEVSRDMVEALRAAYARSAPQPVIEADGEYVGLPTPPTTTAQTWPGDESFIATYVDEQTAQRLAPIEEALRARGIVPRLLGREGESAARTILYEVDATMPDVVVIGSRGRGRFEGLLGSTSATIVRRCPVPVLVIKD